MTRDKPTKHDQPAHEAGKGNIPAKDEVETRESAEALAQDESRAAASGDAGIAGAAAEQARPKRRKKAEPKAEGTAAAATGVGKEVAAAAKDEQGEEAPEPKEEPATETPVAAGPTTRRARGGDPGTRPVVRAQAKFVRTSARKARLVCDHIRGKSVDEARAILAHTTREVAEDWRKLLESAVANAENNHDLDGDDLRILSVHADEGPTLKRFRPRAMGRATRIRKRTSHLTIMLTPKER